MQLNQEIENRFRYHRPTDGQVMRYTSIRDIAKGLAHTIDITCPQSLEKSLAMTKLQEAVMWANASIACHEPDADCQSTEPAKTYVVTSYGLSVPLARTSEGVK